MRVRLPEPPTGWRAFAGKIVIIVIGVLIALGAQQLVENANERRDVAKIVEALRAELGNDRARWEHIRASDPCTVQRLDAIEQWVRTAPEGEKLSDAYRLFLWNMHSSIWDLAQSSAATSDIPLKERLTYATLYGAINNWRPFINEENENARAMHALLASADEPDNRRQVRFRLEVARHFVRRRQLNYDYMFTRFDALGIEPDDSQLTVRFDDKRLCAPLIRSN